MARYMPVHAGTYQISSKFGPRSGGMHWGLDFAAADGTKIYAAQAGSVVHIGAADGFGQWIVIDHPTESGSGTTVYGHMWDALATGLRQGDQVAAGQHIAFVGNNGDSSGHHLHFEVHPTVWSPRSQQDPEPWLVGALEPGAPSVDGHPRPEPDREPNADHDMLVEIYRLLMTPLPSRSVYRDNNQPVDIWRGVLLNIDGMAHEAYVEREALLGYEPAIAIVRRCAENSDDPQARRRAAFILAKISERVHGESAGDGEVRPHRPPAKKATKAPAKKAATPARKGARKR
jgi:murein DD-endopeptidase MepM/ murein hydrolase activator NlpD